MIKNFSVIVFALLVAVMICPAQDATRVTEDVLMANVVNKVQPEYPAMARQMKLSGTVEIDVFVDAAGQVEKVESVKGNAILFVAAQRALKQWKFKPVKVGDSPSKVVARIGIAFNS